MKTLEYIKMILEKVSFDQYLFEKELRKGIVRLVPADLGELKKWCFHQFSDQFGSLLTLCFADFQLAGSK